MKKKETRFVLIVIILIAIAAFVLINHWFKLEDRITLDNFSVVLLLILFGLTLLPFANKIKIGDFLEFSRLKEKIEEVESNQYLGEIVRNSQGDTFYVDGDGKHSLPDMETKSFLTSRKGEILVSRGILNQLKSSYPIDSVKTAERWKWGDAIFVILNGKKYYVSSMSYFADWGIEPDEIEKTPTITTDEIKLIPTGR